MDLTLRINSDFADASKAFKSLASESEETRKKIEKFSESFSTQQVEKFIDKQKLLEVSLTSTRGSTEAMQAASNNYGREIERLIKSGLDPESEAIKKLAAEQNKLKDKIKEATDKQEAQAKAMENTQKVATAYFAAVAAGVAAIGLLSQKSVEMGDQFAKSSRLVGMTAEELQELDYAAKMSGVSDIQGHLQKLNTTIIDTKNGTGKLTEYLKKNDQQLLSQVKGAKSNEQAFNLLIDAISKAPDEFTKAELATAAFGKSGQEMILMAENGVEGIQSLREELREYGIITNEQAKNSELYLDAQNRMKKAISGVGDAFAQKLLPDLTNFVNGLVGTITKIKEWVNGIEDLPGKLKLIGTAVAVLGTALGALLIIDKISKAMAVLNAVMLANPIGLIVAAVAALVVGLILVYKNWDSVQTYLSQGVARLEYAFKWLASKIKEGLLVAFSAIKAAGATLIDFIYGNIVRAVGNLLEVMGKLPFVGEMFDKASQAVNRLGNAMGNMAAEARANVAETIQLAKEEQEETQKTLDAKLAAIDEAAVARRAELEEMKKAANEKDKLEENSSNSSGDINDIKDIEAQKTKTIIEAVQERLNTESFLKQQARNQEIEAITQLMQKRAELESENFDERIAFLEEQKQILLEAYTEGSDERVAIEKAADSAILEFRKQMADAEKQLLEQRLTAMSTFFGGFSSLLDELGKKNKALATAGKVLAMAEAGINTAVAATKALASVPYPFNFIAMAGVIAAGVAQQIKIGSTLIPSAETGGRFIVPNNMGVDSVGLRVNPGEQIDVTPRGQVGSGQEHFNFNFVMDGRVFAEITNKLARRGELYTLALAGNL